MKQKISFKKRLLISIPLLLIGSGFVIWFIFKPEYEFHYFKLNDCDNSYLTAVVYSKISERGVILAKGKYEDVPTDNFIIFKNLSGFDTYFKAVATCENNAVVVNSIEHFFYKQQGSKDIKPRVVDTDTYSKLRSGSSGTEIYLY